MTKSTFILIVSGGLSPRNQPCVGLAHNSNMKCNVLYDNRFHKSDRTPAYLFQTFYSKAPNRSRPPVPEFVGCIYFIQCSMDNIQPVANSVTYVILWIQSMQALSGVGYLGHRTYLLPQLCCRGLGIEEWHGWQELWFRVCRTT